MNTLQKTSELCKLITFWEIVIGHLRYKLEPRLSDSLLTHYNPFHSSDYLDFCLFYGFELISTLPHSIISLI